MGSANNMAPDHALLMVSQKLFRWKTLWRNCKNSRGNASMNLRALMDWGIVYKEYKAGERREFYS
jgi:DNA-binding transcriptional regulator GbsR (MarR family)